MLYMKGLQHGLAAKEVKYGRQTPKLLSFCVRADRHQCPASEAPRKIEKIIEKRPLLYDRYIFRSRVSDDF